MDTVNCNSLSLIPVEILEQISANLNDADLLSLALTSQLLYSNILKPRRYLSFQSCYNLNPSCLQSYLSDNNEQLELVSVNFSNCYWLSSELITGFLKKTPYLMELNILRTRLVAAEVVDVVKVCANLKQLSVTVDGEDETFWKSVSPSIDDDDESLTVLSRFADVQDTLQKLTHLTLHGDCYSYVQIAVFLSFTSSLKALHIDISTLKQPTFSESIGMGSLIRRIPHLPDCSKNLEKFSCVMNDTTKGGPFFNLVKCIKAWRSKELQQFWVPDFPLYHLRTLESKGSPLISLQGSDSFYFHVANYAHLRYLAVDCSVRHLINNLPELEFLSCVFETNEVFNAFCENHSKLRNLQLRYSKDILQDVFVGTGFCYLKNLQKFSVDSFLLHDIRGSNQMVDIFRDDVLEELGNHCKNITELEILQKNYRLHLGKRVLEKFPRLKLISFHGNLIFPAEECPVLPHLQTLRLGSTPSFIYKEVHSLEQNFESLRDLRLQCEGYLETLKVLSSLGQFSSLQRICLHKPNESLPNEVTEKASGELLDTLFNLFTALPQLIFAFIQFDKEIRTKDTIEKLELSKPSLWVYIGPDYRDHVPQAHVKGIIETDGIFVQPSF